MHVKILRIYFAFGKERRREFLKEVEYTPRRIWKSLGYNSLSFYKVIQVCNHLLDQGIVYYQEPGSLSLHASWNSW